MYLYIYVCVCVCVYLYFFNIYIYIYVLTFVPCGYHTVQCNGEAAVALGVRSEAMDHNSVAIGTGAQVHTSP